MKREERWGLLMAMAGFATFSVGDGIIKSITGQWSPVAIATMRYILAASVLCGVMRQREGRVFPVPLLRWHLLRGSAVGIGAAAFFIALNYVPLAEATAVLFTSPMLAVVLSFFLLGEPIRLRAVGAIIVALAGVMLILRPNLATAGLAALFPLVTATTTAVMIIGNRKAVGSGSNLAMQAYMALFGLPILLVLGAVGHFSGNPLLYIEMPSLQVLLACAIVAGTASFGHHLVFLGTTRAGAAAVAPMMYVQLLVAMAIGWAVYGEMPDRVAMVGVVLIVAAGLLMLGRRTDQVRSAPSSEHG